MKKILKLLFIAVFLFSLFKLNVKAASGFIGVKSSTSTVIVGRTFTTTVTVSSSVPLGSWEYTINYNPSLLKLESGNAFIADYGNGTKKSVSYTYTFKALASGTSTIGVKSYGAYAWNEEIMSLTSGTSTVNSLTQAQLEASYSKNNNLSSLSVEGQTLSPIFNKDTLSYTVELAPNIENINVIATLEDNRSRIDGIGTKVVTEGDNKIELTVTAQNGATKKYTLNAIVKDPNPIGVTTINNDKMTIVKRESLLKAPDGFIKNTVNINDILIPSFYNQENQLVLIGLKDLESNIKLYIYNKVDNKYSPYIELTFNKLRILPLELKKDINIFKNYKETTITINDNKIQAYKMNTSSEFAIFYGTNIDEAKTNYYIYDSKENSVIRYNNEEAKLLNKEIDKNNQLLIILTISNIITLSLLITSIAIHFLKKKKPIKIYEEEKEKEIDIIEEPKKEKQRKKKKEKLED